MNWIEESAAKGKALRRQYKLRDIEIFIKDKLPEDIDPDFVFKYVASAIPEHLLADIDIIYIGDFENLTKRNIRGVYEDGAIFITNEQSSEMDLIDDLIHEISHSIEYRYKDVIYGDGELEKEFKRKREQLFKVLEEKGLKPPLDLIHDINFSQKIDDYFFKEIGYPILGQLVILSKIFIGAYSATSVREYFAAGFEAYFLNEKQLVFDMCPVLYSKLKALDNLEGQ